MIIINDPHLGVSRQAGTTPQSKEDLRHWMFDEFTGLIACESHVVVNGDLFDDFVVTNRDLLDTFVILGAWLAGDSSRHLCLIAGNHDNSPKADAVSSFTMLHRLLSLSYGTQLTVLDINEQGAVGSHTWAIAHHANQDLFDAALAKAYKTLETCPSLRYLLLHANHDNGFAVESDHSLNVSKEAAEQFTSRGITLIFGHEHQRRRVGEHIIITGNQFPSSISDCLGNDDKVCLRLGDAGLWVEEVTWKREQTSGGFVEANWRDLAPSSPLGDADFIRVTGEVPAAEAADCISRIAHLRREHPAFVITNATRVEGAVDVSDLPAAFQVASKFDVMAFIRENLTDEEFSMVERMAQ